ncbi:hypothetical protein [Undibacterium sp. SXout20W]|uniref:hypothetical protein n=1 Tax=Undibacterium sp. SXout20W TaxID=3413051 RepID=UPI003BEFD76A
MSKSMICAAFVSTFALANFGGIRGENMTNFDVTHMFDVREKAMKECSERYEQNERDAVFRAKDNPLGSIGATYIPRDRGEEMITCMDLKGFSIAFNSLSKFNSVELDRMSRETIKKVKKDDANRALADVNGWK